MGSTNIGPFTIYFRLLLFLKDGIVHGMFIKRTYTTVRREEGVVGDSFVSFD